MFNGDDHVTTMIYNEEGLKHASGYITGTLRGDAVARTAIAAGGARAAIAAEGARVAIAVGGARTAIAVGEARTAIAVEGARAAAAGGA